MIETVDFYERRLPPGHYYFSLSQIPEKMRSQKGNIVYKFIFETVYQNEIYTHKESVPVWKSENIIRALGGKEISPGKMEWDRESTVGLEIEADLVYEVDQTNPDKKWPRLKNVKSKGIEEKIPF